MVKRSRAVTKWSKARSTVHFTGQEHTRLFFPSKRHSMYLRLVIASLYIAVDSIVTLCILLNLYTRRCNPERMFTPACEWSESVRISAPLSQSCSFPPLPRSKLLCSILLRTQLRFYLAPLKSLTSRSRKKKKKGVL